MTALAIRAYGMVTAVGFTGETSCTAMRAGISGAAKANLWDRYSLSYIQAARAPLRQWWEGAGKLIELLAPAVYECLMAAAPVPPERVPLLLGLPTPSRPFRWPGFDERVLMEVSDKLGVRLHPASGILPRGNSAAVAALRLAPKVLSEARVPCCIVAGVDSFLQQSMMQAYNDQERVLTPDNSNGFIPGEAGAAILVAPAADGPPPAGDLMVLGTGLAREKSTIASKDPLRADGLTAAVKAALEAAGLGLEDVGYRITDLNGEHYKFKEANFVIARLLRKRREDIFDLWHPSEFVGECGAAIGPLVFGWALDAARKEYARGDVVLCHFSDDDGERAAAVLRWRPQDGET
jgi:3-oxoacyl-[acyl-carrier-protein] synthase I